MTETRLEGIIDQVNAALTRMECEGRVPSRLLIGHREAAELEASLYRPSKTWLGLRGERIAEDEEFAPKLPYPLAERVTLFGVPIERVDQPSLLGVVAEDEP